MAVSTNKSWRKTLPERLSLYQLNCSSLRTYKVILHRFRIGDSDDPMTYAYPPIHEWKETEKGKWCMQHCENEIVFFSQADALNWGYNIILQGELSEQNLTFFKLKWPE